jgi:hypothetical protein
VVAFGRGKDEEGKLGMRATALVVATDNPLDKFDASVRLGKIARGTVRILVDTGSTPIYVARNFKLDRGRWLVRGMEVPVEIDPEKPDRFEVDWEAIPGIEERVAANDSTLADPIGTRRKVVEALKAAGLAGPDLNAIPGGMGQLAARSEEAKEAATPDRFKEAVEKAAQEPAPSGKARAVVLIATQMDSIVQVGGGADSPGHNARDAAGKHDTVLAVTVPGRAPYAVFVRRFKKPSNKGDAAGAGLPALVSATDPTDVEVLWDELPSLESQIDQRISDGMQAAAAGMAEENEMREQMMDAVQKASKDPGATPAPGAGTMPQLAPGMQEMMAQNAKQALQFVKDPAMRKVLIEQYRAAGIPVDEGDETP